jgi:hypothetical protein
MAELVEAMQFVLEKYNKPLLIQTIGAIFACIHKLAALIPIGAFISCSVCAMANGFREFSEGAIAGVDEVVMEIDEPPADKPDPRDRKEDVPAVGLPIWGFGRIKSTEMAFPPPAGEEDRSAAAEEDEPPPPPPFPCLALLPIGSRFICTSVGLAKI